MIRIICKNCSRPFEVYPSRCKESADGGPFFCRMDCRRKFIKENTPKELTQDRLREVLHYNKSDGIFRWRKPPKHTAGRIEAMDVAGYINEKGRRCIKIDNEEYYAHRLAWFYVHGKWPNGQLDHADLDRDNSAIKNLREATGSQNQANRKKTKSNTSGYKGVRFKKTSWIAQITTGNKSTRHIGSFKTAEEAHEAYCREAKKIHGPFWNGG